MYNQQQQGMNFQPSTSQLQNRNVQRPFQPSGYVQSFYQGIGQGSMNQTSSSPAFQNQSFQNQSFQNQGQMGYQQSQYNSPQQFHTANYQGNRAGHDSYLRADSTNPSQYGFGTQQKQFQTSFQNQASIQGQSQMGGYNQSTGQFHAANYQGNQPGHDSYLRADSVNPNNQQQNQFNQAQTQSQYQNPQSFHTANYQGNQAGHDSYLRADSTQPSQFGMR